MEKIEDIDLAKRILDFLAKRIGAKKIELFYSPLCENVFAKPVVSTVVLSSVYKSDSGYLTSTYKWVHFQIDNIYVNSSKFFKNPDKCLLTLVNKMFEKAQTRDIVSSFDNRIVLHRYECLESILIEMDLNR